MKHDAFEVFSLWKPQHHGVVERLADAANEPHVALRIMKSLCDRALELARKEIKRTLQRLDHLAGVAVVEKGGTIVTAYRATGKRVKRLRDGARLGEGAERATTLH